MKILVTLPESVGPEVYAGVHHAIAKAIGVGGHNTLQLPVTIAQVDTTHPSNYTVVVKDFAVDLDQSWSTFAVLTFKSRPFAPLPNDPVAIDADPEIELQHQEDADHHQEQELAAIYRAMEDAGVGVRSEHYGSHGFSNGPLVRIFREHILVTQSGGIDC